MIVVKNVKPLSKMRIFMSGWVDSYFLSTSLLVASGSYFSSNDLNSLFFNELDSFSPFNEINYFYPL